MRRAFNIDLVYRHFPLHPDTPTTGLSLEALFAGRNIDIPAAKARMVALMEQEGLPYGDRSMTYNSRRAQELAAWAEMQPAGEAIHKRLFQAYFVEGTNLAEIERLLPIVEDLGLSTEDAKQSLLQGNYREAVDADWQRSRDLGITGVPTFVLGSRGLAGAQPYEQLEQFLLEAGTERRGS